MASAVTGVDVAADAVAFAKARYAAPNLDYRLVVPLRELRNRQLWQPGWQQQRGRAARAA